MKVTIFLALLVLLMPAVCLAANAIQPVPEPATGLLLLLGGAGAAAYRKLRSRQ